MKKEKNKYRTVNVFEHIYVWEMHNGPVPKNHVVHHINGDSTDNRIENLMCVSKRDHMELHKQPSKLEKIPNYRLANKVVTVRVKNDFYNLLAKKADEKEMTITEIMRKLLILYVEGKLSIKK